MKRLLILLILLFALPAYAQQCSEETPCPQVAKLGPAMMGSTPVAGKSCAVDSASYIDNLPDRDDFHSVAHATWSVYIGQGNFIPAANITVCSVFFDIRGVVDGGGLAAIDWVVEIWNMSASPTTSIGDTQPNGTCTSTSQHITAAGTPEFIGLSCDLDTTGKYAIVITRSDHTYDALNNIGYWFGTTGVIPGNLMRWFSDKHVEDNLTTNDLSIEIYGFVR